MTGDERITFVSEEEALRFAYAMDAIAPGVPEVDRLGMEVVVSGEALEYLDEALARVGFGERVEEQSDSLVLPQPEVGELKRRAPFHPVVRLGILVVLTVTYFGVHVVVWAAVVVIAAIALLIDHRRGSAADTEVK